MELNIPITLHSSEQYDEIVKWCDTIVEPAPPGVSWIAWTWSGSAPPATDRYYTIRYPTTFSFARSEDAIMFRLRWAS